MSDSVYVGSNAGGLEVNQIYKPITQVVIEVDNDTSYSAGDTSGMTLTIDCPWGSKKMASNILSQVQNYAYLPFSASDVYIDPAVELGDSVTIGGVYSVIASQDIEFDHACLSSVSAPEGQEVDSEYPYLPPLERKVNQANNNASNAMDTANNAQNTADSALDAANDAQNSADSANDQITAWRYPGSSVQIDGANIKAGTVKASELLGGVVGLLNAAEQQVGTLTISGSSSASYSIVLSSGGALRLSASTGSIYLEVGGLFLQIGSNVTVRGNFHSSSNGAFSLGTASFKWTDVYATNATIQTSDEREKEDINYDVSNYDKLFDSLKPATFRFKDGKSGRTHFGFVAQDVEKALQENNIDHSEFAAIIKSPDGDDYIYGLRYGEFIAMNTKQIQTLKKEYENVKIELAEIKQRLEALENGR